MFPCKLEHLGDIWHYQAVVCGMNASVEPVEKPLEATLHSVVHVVRYKYVYSWPSKCFPTTLYPEIFVFISWIVILPGVMSPQNVK